MVARQEDQARRAAGAVSLTADLSGKSALVTGASSGLGAHFARLLARSGANVTLAARRKAVLDEIAAELARESGRATALALDLTDEQSVVEAVEIAGPIDILVNNAGINIAKPLLEQTAQDWDDVVDTNLRGAFLMAATVARGMRERGGGTIVNIASIG